MVLITTSWSLISNTETLNHGVTSAARYPCIALVGRMYIIQISDMNGRYSMQLIHSIPAANRRSRLLFMERMK